VTPVSWGIWLSRLRPIRNFAKTHAISCGIETSDMTSIIQFSIAIKLDGKDAVGVLATLMKAVA
jgi:hypothetical protein